eukprot:11830874-Ditylum_brightwellii.AAC.1
MRDRLKKYKKAFIELTMRQRQKKIETAMEIMCCSLVKEDVGKDWSPLEKMIITSLNCPYDENAWFGNDDTICTTKGNLEAVLLSSVRMAGDWKFNKDNLLIIASQQKVST